MNKSDNGNGTFSIDVSECTSNLPPGAKFIMTLPVGSQVAVFNGKLIVATPDQPPFIVTENGPEQIIL